MDKIDAIDVQILDLLQERGRIKRNQIAEAVGLSVPSVSDRMRKLEERGVITGYHATVEARRVGYDITAFIRVLSTGSDRYDDFVAAVTTMPEVLELHSITGEGSHMVKVRTRDTASLERLLAQLQRQPGVRGTQTSIVLTTMKESRALTTEPGPLTPLPDPD